MHHAAIRLAAALVTVALTLSASSSLAGAQASPSAAPATVAAPDSARLALARELMDVMAVGPTMLKGLELGLSSQKAASPNIPEAFWAEFAARARRNVPKLVETVVPIYASRFTTHELRDMIAFYRTPAGHHLAADGGAISAEMMRAGQLWGIEIGADTMKELAAKGIVTP